MAILSKTLGRWGKSKKSQRRHRRHLLPRTNLRIEPLESRIVMSADSVLPVLMVIADDHDFYYQEYGDTRIGLEAEGVDVQVAARTTNPSRPHPNSGQGSGGGTVTPDLALADVDPDEYSAILFVGGWGSSMYQYDFPGDYTYDHYDGDLATKRVVNDLINEFIAQDKHLAAICHGVTVLAWARVDGVSPLVDRQVSVPYIGSPAVLYDGQYYSYFELGQYEQVVANGATANTASGQYGDPTTVADDVVVDGRIITAENYDAALAFGRRVAQEVQAVAGGGSESADDGTSDPGEPANDTPASTRMDVGMNLSIFSSWSRQIVYKDAFLQSSHWSHVAFNTANYTFQWQNPADIQTDPHGWVTELPANEINGAGELIEHRAQTVIFDGGGNPAGVYAAVWEGEGTLWWNQGYGLVDEGTLDDGRHYRLINVAADQVISLQLSDVNPENHVRNIQVLMPGSYDPQTLQLHDDSIFYEPFTASLSGLDAIRTMQATHTNTSDDVDWFADRTLPTDARYNGGIPWEHTIALANELGADVWVNVPHAANDDYIRQMAQLFREQLNPDLTVHVEYSNELWNTAWGFEQGAWVQQQLALPENAGLGWNGFVAGRINHVFSIWSDEFADEMHRIERVVGVQQANPSLAQWLLPLIEDFDALSPTGYAGMNNALANTLGDNPTVDDVLDLVQEVVIPWSLDRVWQHQQIADQYRGILGHEIDLRLYEGGVGGNEVFGHLHQDLVHAAYQHPRMYDLQMELLAGLEQIGVDQTMHYVNVGANTPGPWGYFGSLDSLFEPLEAAHERRALHDFAAGEAALPVAALAIHAESETILESDASGNFVVRRNGNLIYEELSVSYVVGGNATPGADFEALSGMLHFAAGQREATIPLRPVLDTVTEGDEYVTVSLATGDGYALAGPDSATITLEDVPLVSIVDQVISSEQDTLEIVLPAGFEYAVRLPGNLAWELDQAHAFYAPQSLIDSDYGLNYAGLGERWVQASHGSGGFTWHFITPSGDLYRWEGSVGASTLVAGLGSEFHADPSLLTDAQAMPIHSNVSDNVLVIDPADGFVGQFDVVLSVGSGATEYTTGFSVTVTATVELPDPDPEAAAEPLPVLLVISNTDFYYQDYADTRASLEAAGVSVVIAAASLDVARPHANSGQGSDGGFVQPDVTIFDVVAAEYSAVAFVGGWGMSAYQYATSATYDNAAYNGGGDLRTVTNALINDFVAQEKYVAAVCYGVSVLAWARVDGESLLADRTVAGWEGISPHIGGDMGSTRDQIEANGANMVAAGSIGDPTTSSDDVIVDGRIITAQDYDSAAAFGRVIAERVTDRQYAEHVDAIFANWS